VAGRGVLAVEQEEPPAVRRASLILAAVLVASCAGASSGATPIPTQGPAALPAGTYTSAAFRPAVTYTVPAGWRVTSDASDYFALQPVDSEATGIHLFRDPLAASQDAACLTIAEPGVGKLSLELATWIRGSGDSQDPRMATVGGLRGVELDLALNTAGASAPPTASPRCRSSSGRPAPSAGPLPARAPPRRPP
jgi:hypothetical protein